MGEQWPSGLLGAWDSRGGDPRPHTSPFPVLQFELIAIFAAAFPQAPFPQAPVWFALFSNWVEIRLDSHEFVHDYWWPVAERAQGTGSGGGCCCCCCLRPWPTFQSRRM